MNTVEQGWIYQGRGPCATVLVEAQHAVGQSPWPKAEVAHRLEHESKVRVRLRLCLHVM